MLHFAFHIAWISVIQELGITLHPIGMANSPMKQQNKEGFFNNTNLICQVPRGDLSS